MKRKFSLGVAAAVALIWPSLLVAQRGIPRTRIREAINESQRKVLSGNTHGLARAQFDRGVAPADLPMERMMLVLTRSPEQQANLDRLLQELTDSTSPRFHQWLTPEQFGDQYGASDQDIQTVTNWLSGQGFRVEQPLRGKTIIEFSGTAGQVSNAFHTQIHKYTVNGEQHWANASDPEIPTALAPVVAGVATLHNFAKQPQFQDYGVIGGSGGLVSSPAFNSSSGSHFLGPSDYATIYNINPAYQSGITGSGVTIAVVARSNLNLSDIASFRSFFGLPANPPQIVVNGTNPGDRGGGEETEVVLDASWSGAVAPNATIKVVVSRSTNSADGVDLSEAYIINNNLADIMTESFGSCESGYTAGQAAATSSLAAQAAAQGITYLVSTGDSGASGCSSPTAAAASGSISVNTLAANPYVIAVGGTQLNDAAGGYWGASNNSSRGSALSYIPENAWNESCSAAQCGASGAGLWATGGGASIFYAKPTWQTGVPGIPNDGARDIPDVSLTAGSHDPYLICVRSSCSSTTPSFSGIAGTSASAPSFAGVMALVVQKAGSRQGQANVTLYRLAASQNMALCDASLPGGVSQGCVFNDVTAGNNAVPGQANYGTPQASYQTGFGYDLATGLGSVNVSNLVNSWGAASVTFGATPALSLSASDLDFGSVPVGVSSTQTLTLSNTGTANLAISSLSIASDSSGVFRQTNNCGSIVSPRGSCTITVTFLPTLASPFTAILALADNATGSPQSISLSGNGAGSSTLSVSPVSLDFGPRKLQFRSETKTIQLANSTSQSVSVSGIAISGANGNDFSVASACGTTLSSGQSCSVNIVFTPQLLGNRSASIVVTSSLPDSPETIQVSGSGVLTGAFEIASSLSGKVLDVQDGSSGNGALIGQNALDGQSQQQWVFYPVDNG
ncbi:MAG: choice-of-anchor D domain-containing protein, partial [Bryobacteraceae bacterium]